MLKILSVLIETNPSNKNYKKTIDIFNSNGFKITDKGIY